MAKKILIADDNDGIRHTLRQLFQNEADYEICGEASNGLEAVQMASSCRPNLIILDLSMPLMDGVSAAKKFKRLMPDVPIILFTQFPDLGRNLAAVVAVDRVVSKDNPKELIRSVKALIAP
jgi:DNA-binding NarL/FixJ family response regulator